MAAEAKKSSRRLYLLEWLEFLGLDKSDIVGTGKAMSWSTLTNILSGGSFFSTTVQEAARIMSEKSGLRITQTDLYREPRESDRIELRDQVATRPDCIDINDLPKLLVQKDGKPLNSLQQELLEKFIETLKKVG